MKENKAEPELPWSDFIPGTSERRIAPGVVFRPIRSWHSLTYAGEGRLEVNGDRSGCLGSSVPYTVTHRCYWNTRQANRRISAFLSYPNAMGYFGNNDYFWEIYSGGELFEDIERFLTEDEMEKRIVELLGEIP